MKKKKEKKKKKENFKWWWQDSIAEPMGYETRALPTELPKPTSNT